MNKVNDIGTHYLYHDRLHTIEREQNGRPQLIQ